MTSLFLVLTVTGYFGLAFMAMQRQEYPLAIATMCWAVGNLALFLK